MPRIYEPQVQLNAQLSIAPSNALGEVGGMLKEIAAQKEQKDFAIDLSNAQMKLAELNHSVRNGGAHDTHNKQDTLFGKPIEEGLVNYTMRQFDEIMAPLSKYGQAGKEKVAQLKVGQYDNTLGVYGMMKTEADVNWAESNVKSYSQAIQKGAMSYQDAVTGIRPVVDALNLPPQVRDSVMDMANSEITYSAFQRDLINDPMMAIHGLQSGSYNLASIPVIEKMNSDVDRHISSMASRDIQAINQATSDTFSAPHSQALELARKRGMPEVVAALESAQSLNREINLLTSGDLQANKAKAESLYVAAHSANNSEMKAKAQMQLAALQNREQLVYSNPDIVASQEGIFIRPHDGSPEDFIRYRRELRSSVEARQNSKASFFGADGSGVVREINSTPNDLRPQELLKYSTQLNGREKKDMIRELGAIDPLIGVAISVNDPNLMKDVLGDASPEFTPPKEADKAFSDYFSGADYGDPVVIDHYIKAAKNVYARRAQRIGWSESDATDNLKGILNELTGGNLSFGNGKTTNFTLASGKFADLDIAERSLENALETGYLDSAYTPDGQPINLNQIKDYGRLVPTGENGKYYLVQNDNQFYLNKSGSMYVVDMNSIYDMKFPKDSILKKFMEGKLNQ